VTIGTPVHDTSTLTGATANAGGTVSYAVYSDNTCTTLVQALGTKTVTNGIVPDSNVWTPNAAGNFWFQATYSGDANNTGPVSSACTSEPITVSPNTPTVATQLVPAGPVAIGTPVHDTAQISGATATAGGSVSFAVYSDNTCTTLVQSLGTVAVVNGVPVGPSNDFTPNSAGDFYFQATYSGDINNTGPVSSVCTTEHLVVNKNTPSIDTVLVPASPVDPGTLVHDTSTLTGATANAGGTVSYAVYSNNTCTTLVQALGTKTVTNGVVPNSDNWTAVSGDFWFQATYSGDANNAGPVKSACTSEPMHVNAPGINIVKKTNGADANDPNGADVPNIKPGDPVTWTYIVTNTGSTHVAKADVHVTDNTTGVTPTFSSEQSGNGDQIFDPGEVWIYTATGTALDLTQPPPAGTHTTSGCTHNNQEPGRTAYINLGTATIPGASDDDPSAYCNPPVKFSQNLTPGFWKNHQAATQALLPLKLGNHTVSTFAEAKIILSGMGCGKGADGPINCMAGMLLAAELNLAQGGNPCIQAKLDEGNALLKALNYNGFNSYSTPTAAQNAQALALHDYYSSHYNIDAVITSC
jgi:hypothetical protein